jgi:hypothetical protein
VASLAQILEDKPAGAVDLLETTLLVKKTQFSASTSNATLPVSQNPKDAAKAVAVTKLYTCAPHQRSRVLVRACSPPVAQSTGDSERVELAAGIPKYRGASASHLQRPQAATPRAPSLDSQHTPPQHTRLGAVGLALSRRSSLSLFPSLPISLPPSLSPSLSLPHRSRASGVPAS